MSVLYLQPLLCLHFVKFNLFFTHKKTVYLQVRFIYGIFFLINTSTVWQKKINITNGDERVVRRILDVRPYWNFLMIRFFKLQGPPRIYILNVLLMCVQ